MSNRTVAFIVLVSICAGLLGAVYYFFIANVGNVIIDVGDQAGVKVVMSGEFGNKEEKICDTKCLFKGIPPINYTVEAAKESFTTATQDFKLSRGVTKVISLKLKKKVEIEQHEKTKEDKILSLKFKQYIASLQEKDDNDNARILIGGFDGKIYAYATTSGFELFSYDGVEEKSLYSKADLNADTALMNSNDGIIIYGTGKDQFIFDLKTDSDYKINISSHVGFVKRTDMQNRYIVDSEDGVYLYSVDSNEYTKNTLFDDFILLPDSKVLGLIRSSSKSKLNLLNFDDNGKNKLVIHDIKTRERKIIYEFEGNATYLTSNGKAISYINDDGDVYDLKDLDIR